MDFFHLSKIFWFLAQPSNLGALLLLAALMLERTRWRRGAHGLVAIVTILFMAVMMLPIDQWVARPLEDRFPRPALPACVDGIVILGGGELTRVTLSRDLPSLDNAGRYTATLALLRHYPKARIVFSGGASELLDTAQDPDAATAKAMFSEIGIDPARVTFEADSRNTWENLVYTQRLVQPKPGETWLLVTAALHMPRSIGIARALGWQMLPWPTDYRTTVRPSAPVLRWNLADNLVNFDDAVREWVGLAAYRLTGRSSAWLPAPEPEPASSCIAANDTEQP